MMKGDNTVHSVITLNESGSENMAGLCVRWEKCALFTTTTNTKTYSTDKRFVTVKEAVI